MWFCQEEQQRAYPACEIECAVEILTEVGDQPGTFMLGVDHCRGCLGQTWVLAGPAGLWQCCVAQQEPV